MVRSIMTLPLASFSHSSTRCCMPARKCLTVLVLTGIALSPAPSRAGSPLPDGFVRLSDIAPEIAQNMRYSGSQNFTGRPVPGYVSPSCILAKPVAEALKRVQAPPCGGKFVPTCVRLLSSETRRFCVHALGAEWI